MIQKKKILILRKRNIAASNVGAAHHHALSSSTTAAATTTAPPVSVIDEALAKSALSSSATNANTNANNNRLQMLLSRVDSSCSRAVSIATSPRRQHHRQVRVLNSAPMLFSRDNTKRLLWACSLFACIDAAELRSHSSLSSLNSTRKRASTLSIMNSTNDDADAASLDDNPSPNKDKFVVFLLFVSSFKVDDYSNPQREHESNDATSIL